MTDTMTTEQLAAITERDNVDYVLGNWLSGQQVAEDRHTLLIHITTLTEQLAEALDIIRDQNEAINIYRKLDDDWRAAQPVIQDLRAQLAAAEVTIAELETAENYYRLAAAERIDANRITDAEEHHRKLTAERASRLCAEGQMGELRTALERAQWAEYYDVDGDHEEAHGEDDFIYFACPACGGYLNQGHKPGCVVAAALAIPASTAGPVLAAAAHLVDVEEGQNLDDDDSDVAIDAYVRLADAVSTWRAERKVTNG